MPRPQSAKLLSGSEVEAWFSRRPREQAMLPREAAIVPTMLTREERQLLYLLGKQSTGCGRIVDAGCFLGGSTAALAAGLRDRGAPPEPLIVSYDMFRVEAYTLDLYGAVFPVPTVGASFRSAFDRNIDPFRPYVTVHEGNIMDGGWNGEPIEILFLDVCKWWDVNDFMLQQFFPALVPGAILVQQDYFWAPTPWIQISMELLADCFSLVGRLGTSAIYVLTSPLPAGLNSVCLWVSPLAVAPGSTLEVAPPPSFF